MEVLFIVLLIAAGLYYAQTQGWLGFGGKDPWDGLR